MKKNNIYLIGPMGAGKTSIGRQLAKLTNKPFYDSDQEIEKRTGATVSLIFELESEAGFRRREEAMIEELTELDGIILASGGGSIINPRNREHLQQNGIVVYLQVPLEEQLERTARKQGTRPMIAGDNPREKLIKLNADRAPLYCQIADLTYDTSKHDPVNLARLICEEVEKMTRTDEKD